MNQVSDDGVPISANFPQSTENVERGEQCDQLSLDGENTKKRKFVGDDSNQPKFIQPVDNQPKNADIRKSPLPYIGMIAEAISSSPDKKMVLSEIYIYMEQHFFPYLSGKPRWRNTVRHNLSFHKCFVKCECSRRGNRSHFWSIHPDYIDQFKRGNFTKTLNPPRESMDLPPYALEQHAFPRNPHEQFHRLFPNPSYEVRYDTRHPPNSTDAYIHVIPSFSTPSTTNVLHPLPHHEQRSFPLVPTSSPRAILSHTPRHFSSDEGNRRFFPTEPVITPYQYHHLVPFPWQYQQIHVPGSVETRANHEMCSDPSRPTSQNSANAKS